MKKHGDTLVTYNYKIYISMILVLCLFFVLVAVFFSSKILAVDETVSAEPQKVEFQKNTNPIDLEEIIAQNSSENVKQEIVEQEIEMEYTTRYRNNSELGKGSVQVLQEGRAGKKSIVIIKKYKDDELISEEQVSEQILKAPVERIVEIGTGNIYNNYKVNVGDTVYVVSASVAVRLEPNQVSEKICTLNKNDSAKVLKIEEDWYFISNVEIKGYVPSDCVTSKNPNIVESVQEQYSKQQLASNLSFDMDLRKTSGLSLEQFKKVLCGNPSDKNNVFGVNAEYFYYVEKQYGINGIFVASVAIHESAWGTSKISIDKKNLFGYGAYDSNPYGGAYSFSTYSEGIDLLARVFVKYYLNAPGTEIYDGSLASGKFYNGTNLRSVNSKYASDPNWCNAVYKWMKYLYDRL